MPNYKVDKEGYALGDDGNRIEIDGELLKIINYTPQEQIDAKLKERLEREAKKYQDQIKALETQANRTPELEKLLDETKKKLSETAKELEESSKKAHEEVSAQMQTLKKERDDALKILEAEKQARTTDQVTNLIMSNCFREGKPLFVAPEEDIIPKFLKNHKREPKRNEQGEVIEGEFVDLFKTQVKKDNGDVEEKYLTVEKAIDSFIKDPSYARYLNANNVQGSGIRTQPGMKINTPTGESVTGVNRIARGIANGQLPLPTK